MSQVSVQGSREERIEANPNSQGYTADRISHPDVVKSAERWDLLSAL